MDSIQGVCKRCVVNQTWLGKTSDHPSPLWEWKYTKEKVMERRNSLWSRKASLNVFWVWFLSKETTFCDKVSLCGPGRLRTRYVAQAGLKPMMFSCFSLASVGIIGMSQSVCLRYEPLDLSKELIGHLSCKLQQSLPTNRQAATLLPDLHEWSFCVPITQGQKTSSLFSWGYWALWVSGSSFYEDSDSVHFPPWLCSLALGRH